MVKPYLTAGILWAIIGERKKGEKRMKKKHILLLLCALLLSGCSHRHEWQEATCTEAKYCTSCQEVEGEPLGHDFTEPDCTTPRTCRRCGITEGEPLGHEPSEANYQDASVCLRCGIRLGEKRTADFERYGIACTAENGVSYDYHTCARDDTTPVLGQVTFTERSDEPLPVNLEELEGYEWRYVLISLVFDDSVAVTKNVRWSITDEDYYTIELHDDSRYMVDGGSDGFTVNFHGEDYTECLRYYEYDNGHWDTNVYYVDYAEWFRVPVGYDGIVVGVRDSSIQWTEGAHIHEVINENAVFYRLK